MLCSGVRIPFGGTPSLHLLPISYYDAMVNINVFGIASKKPTLVIKIEGTSFSGMSSEAVASALVGRTVHIH